MTAHTEDKPQARRAETGWARARRLRRAAAAPRTCLPAVAVPGAVVGMQSGPEWNIVRGED
ncbi:hypothetical protein [Streptomyces rishiriensis]|uniref:Uncharacterized protein n=1 Tax=Streptomyces rishiriensis TaxID=68264 RepID=A0ABU0P0S0_STRRH|nr:hypothetical protein [Streptomyces rishiriensis]MDQ0584991.1 hypothetical protein [Streptomyces rishiriensis]